MRNRRRKTTPPDRTGQKWSPQHPGYVVGKRPGPGWGMTWGPFATYEEARAEAGKRGGIVMQAGWKRRKEAAR
jgi:hypothetical protein